MANQRGAKREAAAKVDEVKNTAKAEKIEEKVSEKAENTAEKTFTRAEVDAIVAEAIAKAMENAKPAPTVQVTPNENVMLVFAGAMASGTVYHIPHVGNINSQYGFLICPKTTFFQNITDKVQRRLDSRELIVVSGLDDNERARYGVNYKENELLDEKVFRSLVTLDVDEIIKTFKRVCPAHKRIIALAIMSAWEKGEKTITADQAKKLNDISKDYEPSGMFTYMLDKMSKELTE